MQRQLLDIAAADAALIQLRQRRATLPELARAAELKNQREQLADEVTAAETRVSDLERAQQRAEQDLVPVRERLAKDQERIDSGELSDGSVLADLIEETKRLTQRISDLEDAEIEVMEQLEEAVAERDRLIAARADATTEMGEVVTRGRATMAQIDADVATRTQERAALVAQLPEGLVARYNRIAQQHGTGAALLARGRCLGCQLELNAADLRAIAVAAADDVVHCEECGRILVRTDESGLS